MIETEQKTAEQQVTTPNERPSSRVPFVIFVMSILAIIFNSLYIRNIHYDWLNIIPLLATVYVDYAVIALNKTCGHIAYVKRGLSEDPAARKPFGSFLLSPYVRSMVV